MKVSENELSLELFVKISLCQKTIIPTFCSESGIFKEQIEEIEHDSSKINIGQQTSLSEVFVIFQSILPHFKTLLLDQLKTFKGKSGQKLSNASDSQLSEKCKTDRRRRRNRNQCDDHPRVTRSKYVQRKHGIKSSNSIDRKELSYESSQIGSEMEIASEGDCDETYSFESPAKIADNTSDGDDEANFETNDSETHDRELHETTVKVKNTHLLTMLKSKIEESKNSVRDLTIKKQADERKFKSILKRFYRNSQTNEYVCEICDKCITSKTSLKRHIVFQHIQLNKRSFSCSMCRRVFRNAYSLNSHKRTHKNQMAPGKFKCEHCKKFFISHTSYLGHARLGICRRPAYSCADCGKTFTQDTTYQMHVKKQHANQHENFAKCNKCNNLFASKSGFAKHKMKATCISMFICQQCGKAFRQSNVLKAHLRSHAGEHPEKGFKCGKCLRHFATRHGFEKHDKLCSILEGSISNCKSPVKHNNSSKYICEMCGKSFTQSSTLRKHTKIHDNIRPFKCNLCQKDFPDNFGLKIHTRIHTGEKPYLCNDCGKSFVTNSKLKRHMTSHEKQNIKDEEHRSAQETTMHKSKKSRNTQPRATSNNLNSRILGGDRLRVGHHSKYKYDNQSKADIYTNVHSFDVEKHSSKSDVPVQTIYKHDVKDRFQSVRGSALSPTMEYEVPNAKNTFRNISNSNLLHSQNLLHTNTIEEVTQENYMPSYNPHYTPQTLNSEYAIDNSNRFHHNISHIQYPHKVQNNTNERPQNIPYFDNEDDLFETDDRNSYLMQLASSEPMTYSVPHNQNDRYQYGVPPPPYPSMQYSPSQSYLEETDAEDSDFRLLDFNRYLPAYDMHSVEDIQHP